MAKGILNQTDVHTSLKALGWKGKAGKEGIRYTHHKYPGHQLFVHSFGTHHTVEGEHVAHIPPGWTRVHKHMNEHLGSSQHDETLQFGEGVVDEDLWEKAKKEVSREKYPDDDSYYAVVSTVYKKMGGRYESKADSSQHDETEQFSEYYDDNPSAQLLHKSGFKQSLNRLGTGKHDTRRSFSHLSHGLIHHYSNGSWEHYNGGKLIREGQGHADLKAHLSSLRSSQHDETEQFAESNSEAGRVHNTLAAHGFRPNRSSGSKDHTIYSAPHSHSIIAVHKTTGAWEHGHKSNGRRIAKGKTAGELHRHLSDSEKAQVSWASSQHDEVPAESSLQGNEPVTRRSSAPLGPPIVMVESAEQFDEKKSYNRLHDQIKAAGWYHHHQSQGKGDIDVFRNHRHEGHEIHVREGGHWEHKFQGASKGSGEGHSTVYTHLKRMGMSL